ncbi:hypothetical protein CVT25_003044 [Psilocybe cyanescens]|uniref:Uncharacterized protein n=1 Tax=Psilocybe cyanescens TaxID=93625 RepID=A0A409WNA9_PSICY|nr:hypothetical protein CVT25_003044 [Psilocybe cyanescens]
MQWMMWKHHFSPVDTSNALAWLTIPAYCVIPRNDCINQLPNELLTKIFAHVLHSESSSPKDRFCRQISRRISSGSSPTTPIMLTHVSRFWRATMHDTPTLWSTISVVCPEFKDVECVSFLLKMTGNCPLTLDLEQYMTPDPVSLEIAQLFVSEAHRWKNITLTLFGYVQDAFSGMRPGDVKSLESYRVHVHSWDSSRVEQLFQVLHSSPVLHAVDWGKSLDGELREDVPWSRLSEITLHRVVDLSQSVLTALSNCESLKTLRMRRIRRPYDPISSPVTLTNLTRLICDRPDNFEMVFNSFTLPALCELEITDRKPLSPADVKAFTDFIDRSGCVITTLSIDGCSMSILPLISAYLTKITTLNVLSNITDDFRYLMKDSEQVDILPNLRHLILHNCCAADGTLADVVWSRRNELLAVQVCMESDKAPRDDMTLGWLKQDGVLVSIYKPVAAYSTFYFVANNKIPGSKVVSMVHIPDADELW